MYEAFYKLREKPFSILPDPDLIYWCQSHRLAFAMLEFGVMNSAGFTVITGEIGCGKTTLVRYLLRKLDDHVTACLISNTPRTQDGLLPWIMMSLNLPFAQGLLGRVGGLGNCTRFGTGYSRVCQLTFQVHVSHPFTAPAAASAGANSSRSGAGSRRSELSRHAG